MAKITDLDAMLAAAREQTAQAHARMQREESTDRARDMMSQLRWG